MNIFQRIELYVGRKVNFTADASGEVLLVDEGDGQGLIITRWDIPDISEPTMDELNAIPEQPSEKYEYIKGEWIFNIDKEKEAVNQLISAKFNERIAQGFKNSLEITMDFTPQDISLLDEGIKRAKSKNLTSINLEDYYNKGHDVTIEQAELILEEELEKFWHLFEVVKKQLRRQVQLATAENELNVIKANLENAFD